MNNKTLSLTIAVSSLIPCPVMADYTGLSYEGIDNGDGTWTARIYGDFDAGTDELHTVFGDSIDSLLITSTAGFYQNGLGGPTSSEIANINPALWAIFPSLIMDSWVTIQGGDSINPYVGSIGIDWSVFESGGDIFTSDGSWFSTSPFDVDVLAGDDLRVMIGQFTMFGIDSSVSGSLNLYGLVTNGDGTTDPYFERGQVFNFSLPAPSAVALLGLAVVACHRRRK